jgi:hypothetical protein
MIFPFDTNHISNLLLVVGFVLKKTNEHLGIVIGILKKSLSIWDMIDIELGYDIYGTIPLIYHIIFRIHTMAIAIDSPMAAPGGAASGFGGGPGRGPGGQGGGAAAPDAAGGLGGGQGDAGGGRGAGGHGAMGWAMVGFWSWFFPGSFRRNLSGMGHLTGDILGDSVIF